LADVRTRLGLTGEAGRQVRLFEPRRNDDPAELTRDFGAQSTLVAFLGGGGREVKAPELNPLTKYCRSVLADFNGNGVADLSEHERGFSGSFPQGWSESARNSLRVFQRFSHFAELHDTWYEPGPDVHGTLVIAEISRCGGEFPLRVLANAEQDARSYWRGCSRSRDVRYTTVGGNTIGLDLASWSCDSTPAGRCPVLPPPVQDLDGNGLSDDVDDDGIAEHGLCDLEVPVPGEPWRGMNHHSQFKCIETVGVPPANPEETPQRILASALLTTSNPFGRLVLNECNASSGPSRMMGPQNTLASTSPVFECQPINTGVVPSGRVGFAAVTFHREFPPTPPFTEATYDRGCVDEATEFPMLCPGYGASPERVRAGRVRANFGKLVCGCGFNNGGVDCEVGCPNGEVHFGGDYEGERVADFDCDNGYCLLYAEDGQVEPGGRRGYWLCGGLKATEQSETSGGQFRVRGAIPAAPTDGTPLGNEQFSVRPR
jgi:hypothetical protein